MSTRGALDLLVTRFVGNETRTVLRMRRLALPFMIVACFVLPAVASAAQGDVDMLWGQKIPMRDGIELNATILMPHGMQGPLPVVFTLTPYTSDRYFPSAKYFAQHGYVYALVDVRGRGNSGGHFNPFAQEPQDGYDVVEWLARQPWSDGKVAMWGSSYGGFDQWATLKEHPPHLETVAPIASVHPGVDFPFFHEIFYTYDMQWLTYTSGTTTQREQRADDEFWQKKFNDYYFGYRPFSELDRIVGNTSTVFQEWLEHPMRDDWYDAMTPTPAQYRAMQVRILNITGQFDDDQPGALTYYRDFMQYAAPEERERCYLIIGPWDHYGTLTPELTLGGMTFGAASELDMNDLLRRWYDWTMKGRSKPAFLRNHVAYWVTGSEEWRYASSLEAVTPNHLRFLIGSNGRADDAFHSGTLDRQRGGPAAFDAWTYDPLDTRYGREIEQHPSENFFFDQSTALNLFGAGAVYTSQPFQRDITLGGMPRLLAYIQADVPDTDFQCALYQIMPDGTSIALTSDMVRARYRNSERSPEYLTPGKVERIEFNHFFWFARNIVKGSRLRLVIASLNSTQWEKNYNALGDVARESRSDARTAHIGLYHNTQYPSAMEIGEVH